LINEHGVRSDGRGVSFAINVKVRRFLKPKGWEDVDLYAPLNREDMWQAIGFEDVVHEFENQCPLNLSIGTAGRSNGYLTLVSVSWYRSPNRSYCPRCNTPSTVEVLTDEIPDINSCRQDAVDWLYFAGVRLSTTGHLELVTEGKHKDRINSMVTRLELTRMEYGRNELKDRYEATRSAVSNGYMSPRSFDAMCTVCRKPTRVNYETIPTVPVYRDFKVDRDNRVLDLEDTVAVTKLAKSLVLFNRAANQLARNFLELAAEIQDVDPEDEP